MTLSSVLLLTSVTLPLLVAAGIAFAGTLPERASARARRLLSMTALVAVIPAITFSVVAEIGETWEGAWLLFGTHLMFDDVARPLVLITALLYGAALMAITSLKLRNTERAYSGLSAFLLVCFVGNMGTYIAADTVTFYLAFGLMSFSAAGLVVYYRSGSALRATRIYLVMTVLSETAVLAALLLIAGAGGYMIPDATDAVLDSGHTGLMIGLLIFGFGVKAGTVPLHVWLPLAHPAAPSAASAVLSGAMVKAGALGWIRFLPTGESSAVTAGGWVLLGLALLGAFAAVVVGVLQSNPKVILAYSTISQMGFIGALIAVGMLVPELYLATTTAAVLYAVHHGLAKGALFLGVPVVKHYGHGRTGIVVMIGIAGAALAVAGAPLTSGAFGKYVSKEAVDAVAVLGVGLDSILPLVATGSTLLLMRWGWVMWHAEREPRRQPDGELFSWCGVAMAGIVVPWLVGMYWFSARGLPLAVPGWEAGPLWDASWPILLGLGVGGAVWWMAHAQKLPRALARADGSLLAPGDVVVAEESWVNASQQRGGRMLILVHSRTQQLTRIWSSAWGKLSAWSRERVGAAESRLTAWESSGVVMVRVLAVSCLLVFSWTGAW